MEYCASTSSEADMPAPSRTHSSKGTEGLQKAAPDESILWFDQRESSDVSRVGGKNAGLAEVTRTLAGQGIRVPPGFATTAAMYHPHCGLLRCANQCSGSSASH